MKKVFPYLGLAILIFLVGWVVLGTSIDFFNVVTDKVHILDNSQLGLPAEPKLSQEELLKIYLNQQETGDTLNVPTINLRYEYLSPEVISATFGCTVMRVSSVEINPPFEAMPVNPSNEGLVKIRYEGATEDAVVYFYKTLSNQQFDGSNPTESFVARFGCEMHSPPY